jgi:hypothetical protein
MSLFEKNPTAAIYLDEMRTGFDPDVIPVFTPDMSVDVGDFGSFENGRFVNRGNVAARGVGLTCRERQIPPWSWASSGKVSVGPSLTLPGPTGNDLVKTTLKFSRARAVAASFESGFDRSAGDADLFGRDLMGLWLSGELSPDRVVVWSVRRASKGTVLVSHEKDNEVELVADAGLLAGAGLTLANMSLGVQFGQERKSTYKVSSGPLTIWVRMLRLLPKDVSRVGDVHRFEPGTDDLIAAIGTRRPVALSVDDVLAMD